MRPILEDGKFLSDWKYVELARYVPSLSRVIRDKVGDSPLIVSFDEVKDYAAKNNNTGVYTSVWLFNSKDIDNSIRYSNLYFDLDNKDISISYNDTVTLIEYLSKYIKTEGIKIYFTGKKGFHIECEATCLGIAPSNTLPTVFRYIASDLKTKLSIDSIDLSVYDARRMWRLTGTKHQDTGLYKTLISEEELLRGVDYILDLCKDYRETFYADVPFYYKANEWYREYSYKMEEDKEKQKDYLSYFNKHGSKGLRKFEESQKDFQPKVLFEKCPSFKRIYQEAKNNHHLDHESRLFLCSILTYTEESIELLHEILSNCDDYNVEKSTAHIQDWIRRREMGIGGRPYTCERANTAGVGCGDCSLDERKKWVKIGDRYVETNEKSSPSPIRFAYKNKRKEKENGQHTRSR